MVPQPWGPRERRADVRRAGKIRLHPLRECLAETVGIMGVKIGIYSKLYHLWLRLADEDYIRISVTTNEPKFSSVE
jgi:hypothetical protein